MTLALAACSGDANPTTTAATVSTTTVSTTAVTSTAVTTTVVTTTAGPLSSTTSADDGFPVTVETPAGPVTVDERPAAVVSLSASATEMLFALGAGDQVVATDEFSDYPPEAPTTELSGITPNLESIASYGTDLVIASFDPDDMAAGLSALGIPVLIQDAAVEIDDVYAQIEQLGAVTGNGESAGRLVAAMRADVAEVVAELPQGAGGLTYYHELDDQLFTVTSATFIGQVYDLLGLVNIADAADQEGAGYIQLSEEYLIEADPDLIFLADTRCCSQSAATVAERPGWNTMQAVVTGAIVELDDDVASRWGPRIVDFLQAVGVAVAEVVELS
jgi:iron complex transport system substrate-binding protein